MGAESLSAVAGGAEARHTAARHAATRHAAVGGIAVPFVDLVTQHAQLRTELLAEISVVLDTAGFILGPQVAAFERAFADYVGVRCAVGVANGTDAITLTLRALNIGPGDEVVTAANTFVATVEAIAHAGARPVLADVDPETLTLDPRQADAVATARTRAIIPVHLCGHPADMDPLHAVARAHGAALVEDASQAHGAAYRGGRVGSIGRAACFSLYPSKNLGACGDAGVVVTDDPDLDATLRRLRHHGSVEKYQHDLIGYNSRLDALQAAVLLVKLRHLDAWNERRRTLAHRYDTLLGDLPGLRVPAAAPWATSVYHLYVVRVGGGLRDPLRHHLEAEGIETAIHYPTPVHLQPAFRHLSRGTGTFPVAERAADETLSLPLYPELTEAQVEYVAGMVSRFLHAREDRA